MHFLQSFAGDVRINFRGTDAGMAEHFLDDPQVSAMFEEMRGKTVAQHVGRDVSFDPEPFHSLFNSQP